MLRAVLNKSHKPATGHLPPISKTIQVKRTRHTAHRWRIKNELIRDIFLWTLYADEQEMNDQLELIFNGSLQTQDVVMDDRDGWRERVRGICVSDRT